MLYTLQDLDTNEIITVNEQQGIELVNDSACEDFIPYDHQDWLEGLHGLYTVLEIKGS